MDVQLSNLVGRFKGLGCCCATITLLCFVYTLSISIAEPYTHYSSGRILSKCRCKNIRLRRIFF